ncbi:MAG TPA: hypothetical protein VNF69_16065 [Burkholderiales bacterium]|nr:hypothetical protein [Burkholderiales bacterium]
MTSAKHRDPSAVVLQLNDILTKCLSEQGEPREAFEFALQACDSLRASGLDQTGTYHVNLIDRYATKMLHTLGRDRDRDEGGAIDPPSPDIGILKCVWNLEAHLVWLSEQRKAA